MVNTWWFNILAYWILQVMFTQFYKIVTKSSKNDGSLTILLQFLSGIIVLTFLPFFNCSFPNDIKIYISLSIACVFYAIADRVNTSARRGLEVSVYSILAQLSTVFVITWGIIFFKEAIVLKKILGACLILFGNALILYKKGKVSFNKYILFSILGNLAMSIGISVDVGISNQFNLPIYVAITLIVPAILIFIFERIRVSDVVYEFKNGNKKAIIIVCCSWGLAIISRLRAYQFGEVTTIAPLCAITKILNALVAYFLLKEKGSLLKKILAIIIVILGIILIKL